MFTSTALSEAKTFGSVDLDLRYDHAKLPDGRKYRLYRWNGSAWQSVASGTSTADHVVSVSGLDPASGQTFNVGTFALLWVSDPFVLSVR